MHKTSVQKHVSDDLMGLKERRPDIVKSEKVVHPVRSPVLKCPLNKKNNNIDYNQVLYYGRYHLRTPQTEIGHIATEITGCKLMF
jgi:hypothetical protein